MQSLKLKKIIKPKKIKLGDTIGIFTPSWPAHTILKDKYEHALDQIKKVGFQYVEGNLTSQRLSQGYRSSGPKERADEFMGLIKDVNVKCLMATIGGSNSSSMIPYLDFEVIRKERKIICGYSDVTSLHMAILKYSGLSTFYGPMVVPTFGEPSNILDYSLKSFLNLAIDPLIKRQKLFPPSQWSNHFIDAEDANWKNIKRQFNSHEGWKILSSGSALGKIIVADLETLVSSAGTEHFPELGGHILFIEEMDAPFSKEERNLRHLERLGVFDVISALVVSKPSNPNPEGASFSYDDLIQEIVGKRAYPIISNFDCGHTFPMITLAQMMKVSIKAEKSAEIFLEEAATKN